MGLLTVGVTGLSAAQMGIQTAGHNIANASTPGYNRQQIIQTTSNPTFSGAGFFGQGVTVTNVLRIYNDFQSKQVLNSETVASELSTYSSEITQIDNMLADANAGLSPAMQAFFNAVEEASSNPASVPARQAMLSAAQGLVARFQSVDKSLDDIRSGINQQISFESATINSYVQQLADINQRIIVAQSAGQALPANDLLDQRDQLITDLNKDIRVTTQTQADGTTSVFFGSGQPLLVGPSAFSLQAVPSQDDLTRMEVSLKDNNGTITRIPESLVNGGKLGGLLRFRTETLESAQNSLGRIATVFSATFNAQHRLGQSLTGVVGVDFFKEVAQGTQMVLPSNDNIGSGNIAVTFDSYADLTTSNYRLTMTATNTLSLVRSSDNKQWSANGSNQYAAMASLMKAVNADEPQGFDLTLSGLGMISVGDTFLIRPAHFGARDISLNLSDPRSIALAAPIRTLTAVANAGTAKISAGAVSSTAAVLSAPLTVSYEASSNSLIGFPVGASVDVAGQVYKINSESMRIPYISGSNISFNGTAVTITDGSGPPADGDSFTIPPPLFAPMFGVPALATDGTLGGATPVTPLTVTASVDGVGDPTGFNDQFDIDVDGGGATTITMTAGVYHTPAEIAAQLQLDIDNVLGAGVVTVSLAQENRIQITSATPGGSVSLSPYLPQPPANGGDAVLTAGIVTRTNSLPATPITLKYLQADTTVVPALPARLTGLPVGSVVTVTPTNGTPTSYTITQTGDYIPYASEADIAFNGISFSIGGEPINGDTFLIGPNPTGVSDNRNALLLGSLQTQNTIAGGNATYQSAYAQIVSEIGNKAREVAVASAAQETLVKQGHDMIQSMSGVNLDEEAANLMRFQQAYQASAKMIQVASKLFEEVLALGK